MQYFIYVHVIFLSQNKYYINIYFEKDSDDCVYYGDLWPES